MFWLLVLIEAFRYSMATRATAFYISLLWMSFKRNLSHDIDTWLIGEESYQGNYNCKKPMWFRALPDGMMLGNYGHEFRHWCQVFLVGAKLYQTAWRRQQSKPPAISSENESFYMAQRQQYMNIIYSASYHDISIKKHLCAPSSLWNLLLHVVVADIFSRPN